MHDNKKFPVHITAVLLLFSLLFSSVSLAASTAGYPRKEVSLALPTSPGSQTDIFFTIAQPFLRKYSREPVVLRHVPGRGGGYAWSSLLQKPGDGYTLAALSLPSFLLLGHTKNRLYEPNEVVPVAIFSYIPSTLWVDNASPFKTVADLVQYARQPGKTLTIAGIGSYTEHHMAAMKFDRAAGVKSIYMPFLGSVQAIEAVRNNLATACWGNALQEDTMPGMRPIAVAAPERSIALPETPTFREQKIELINGQYLGVCMPGGAPEDARQMVSDFFLRVTSDEEFLHLITSKGFSPMAVPYQDMPAFMGHQVQSIDEFMNDYSMFPHARPAGH